MRYARQGNQVAYRSGVLLRKFSIGFMDKIQTVAVRQSPLDRRWEMGTLAVDTAAAGPANHRIVVRMLDLQLAEQEFIRLSQLASNKLAAKLN
jgi:putative membrane protein